MLNSCVFLNQHNLCYFVLEMKEFILVASRNHIQALDLVHFQHEDMYTLPAGETGFITAVAFDYIHNRLFWSKAQPARIQVYVCFSMFRRQDSCWRHTKMVIQLDIR